MKHTIIEPEKILILVPQAPLEATDFETLAREIDPYIQEHGRLPGFMIHAKAFPGWKDLAAFSAHMSFAKSHLKKVVRLAIVSDSILLREVFKIASHLIHAEIEHFPDSEYADALQWLQGKAVFVKSKG